MAGGVQKTGGSGGGSLGGSLRNIQKSGKEARQWGDHFKQSFTGKDGKPDFSNFGQKVDTLKKEYDGMSPQAQKFASRGLQNHARQGLEQLGQKLQPFFAKLGLQGQQ